jgi:Skp family chaperone for outer membrane proteins
MADKTRIDSKQGTYQSLQTKLDNADSDEEKAKIMESMRNQAEAFEKEYGFSIETNVVELQNEFNELLDKIDELQDKKIEIAMDWSGSDKVEASMAKAAEFTKIIQNETRKTGSNYVMTAK